MKKNDKLSLVSHLLLCSILLLLPIVTQADVWDRLPSHREEYKENEGIEDYIWKEADAMIPDYPQESDLLEFAGPPAYRNYQYLIDVKNLKVGDDGVVRYSVVIRSSSGADNVMYEGLRCTTDEVKNYAYGSTGMDGKKTFFPRQNTSWKPVSSSGVSGYTSSLQINYFCSKEGFMLSRQEILQNIKYGKGNVDGIYN